MTYYIKFDENGVQQEAVAQSSKPSGKGWYKAKKQFDFTKRYRLTSDDTIREETPEENEAVFVDLARHTTKNEVQVYLETIRAKFSGYSTGKNKAYEAQARSALRVLAAQENGVDIDLLDEKVLGNLANVRSITILEMAHLIKAKMDETDIILGLIDAYEDRAMQVIKDATNCDNLRTQLETIQQELNTAIAKL